MSDSMPWSRFGVQPLKRLALIRSSSVDKIVDENEEPVRLCNYVDVYYNERITAEIDFSVGSAGGREIERFALLPGDVVITKDSETPDDIAVPALVEESAAGTVCGYHLAILRPDLNRIAGNFLFWCLKARPVRDAFTMRAQGITRFGLTVGGIGSVMLPVPGRATQQRIADFLDRETDHITQLIAKKQRLVELLGEKAAAALDAMTFLNDQSSSWGHVPFKWLCRIPNGQVDPTAEPWKEMPLIAPNHIESRTGRLLQIETADSQGAISGKYAFRANTVLYSKIRPALAKACIAPVAGLCSADMYPIIPSGGLLPEYLLMQLLSRTFTDWATLESMRVAMPKINRETIGSIRLLLPPHDIQRSLVSEWTRQKAASERLIDTVRLSIDKLSEFRSALITKAVTGQIDVEHWREHGNTERRMTAIEEEVRA